MLIIIFIITKNAVARVVTKIQDFWDKQFNENACETNKILCSLSAPTVSIVCPGVKTI